MSDEPTNPLLKDYPVKGISTPHAHDVLSGRGGGTNNHPGNTKFRELVQSRKVLYINCTKREKMGLSCAIVDSIRNQDPPGRFLQRNLRTGLWFDIGDQKAREKTSQALREGAPYIRRKISMGAAANALSIAASVANGIHEKDKAKFNESREYTMTPNSQVPNSSLNASTGSALSSHNKVFLGPHRSPNPMLPLHHAERAIMPPGMLFPRQGDPRRPSPDPSEAYLSHYALAEYNSNVYRQGFLPRHPDPAISHHSIQQHLPPPHAGSPYGFFPPHPEYFRHPISRSVLLKQGQPNVARGTMMERLSGKPEHSTVVNKKISKNISTKEAVNAVEPILKFLGKPSSEHSSPELGHSDALKNNESKSRQQALQSLQPVLDFIEKPYLKKRANLGNVYKGNIDGGDVSQFFLQRIMFSEMFTESLYRGNLEASVLSKERQATLYEFAGLLRIGFDILIFSENSLEETIEDAFLQAEYKVKDKNFSKILIRTDHASDVNSKLNIYTDIMRGKMDYRNKSSHKQNTYQEQRITSAFHSINAF